MKRRTFPLVFVFCFALSGADAPALWKQPVELSTRDLIYGSGGKDNQPVGPFTFLEEDMDGTNAKFDVRDAKGTKWKVKLGDEARPEVTASRIMWAVGFSTYDYVFLPSITVEKLPVKLKRGDKLRLEGGTFANVRLKRPPTGMKKSGEWKWKQNPFIGTRELNGLRTLMAVMNNWDLKDENNALMKSADGSTTYMISDLGATFGTDHLIRNHEVAKGNLDSFGESKFIIRKSATSVDFGTPGKPSFKYIVVPKEEFGRMGMQSLGKEIPVADAKWMGELLGQLTPVQIRDAFRTSGYTSDQVEGFAEILDKRIAELRAL